MASFRCGIPGQAGKVLHLCGKPLFVSAEGACRTEDVAQLEWLRAHPAVWAERVEERTDTAETTPSASPSPPVAAKKTAGKGRKGKAR